MSLYQLVQFLQGYVNSEKTTTLIKIKLRTLYNWLHQLRFEYKDIKKDVFVDNHKQPNVAKDWKKKFYKIKKLNLYLLKFNENKTMKKKSILPIA